MKLSRVLVLSGCSAALLCLISPAQDSAPGKSQIERGKYLVDGVARCGDCHTPHLANGKQDSAHTLQGASIEFRPLQKMKWEDHAPGLAGGPRGRWTQADVSHLLQTGLTPRGDHLDAPMPEYHMNAEDADAISAYLFSLPRPTRKAAADHDHGQDHDHDHAH